MKNLSSVISIVLVVAVGYLFIREFSGGSQGYTPSESGVQVAYINSDSLIPNYELHKELKEKLEGQAKVFEADLANKSRVFQENVANLQNQAENLTPSQLQQAQMELQQIQQRLQMEADGKTRELATEERKLDSIIMLDLESVLDEIRTEKNIDFIFSYSRGSSLLSVSEALDLTEEALNRLNKNHVAKKEEEATSEEE